MKFWKGFSQKLPRRIKGPKSSCK